MREKKKGKAKENAKDDLMVNGNDIYSHFNDVLNVNEAKLCFPRTATLHPPGIEVPFAPMPLACK